MASAAVARHLRGWVSQKKNRYQQEGFDLDLTYVTPRVIAMGYPSKGIEAMFRNPATEVQRLLTSHHRDHYKVYNLVSEQQPDFDLFPLVEYFPFGDHNPCPLDLLTPLCESIHAYLEEHEKNVVAIHCKAGKGRTGLVIAAYLLHAGISEDPAKALRAFAEERTRNREGVTIPSQIRYVEYYGHLLRQPLLVGWRPTCQITNVHMKSVPSFSIAGSGCDPYFKVKVWQGRGKSRHLVTTYSWRQHRAVVHVRPDARCVDLDCSGHGLLVRGDVKVVLCHAGFGGKPVQMCSVWFNTTFCCPRDVQVFGKRDTDGACKDAKCKHFAPNFEVRVALQHVSGHSDEELEIPRLDSEGGLSEGTVGDESEIDSPQPLLNAARRAASCDPSPHLPVHSGSKFRSPSR